LVDHRKSGPRPPAFSTFTQRPGRPCLATVWSLNTGPSQTALAAYLREPLLDGEGLWCFGPAPGSDRFRARTAGIFWPAMEKQRTASAGAVRPIPAWSPKIGPHPRPMAGRKAFHSSFWRTKRVAFCCTPPSTPETGSVGRRKWCNSPSRAWGEAGGILGPVGNPVFPQSSRGPQMKTWGLIIVDEEHDQSYKAGGRFPRPTTPPADCPGARDARPKISWPRPSGSWVHSPLPFARVPGVNGRKGRGKYGF